MLVASVTLPRDIVNSDVSGNYCKATIAKDVTKPCKMEYMIKQECMPMKYGTILIKIA